MASEYSRHHRKMDHSLGTGEPNMRPTHGLVGLHPPDTENPQHLPEDANVPDSMDIRTPEHAGHMARIKNKPPHPR